MTITSEDAILDTANQPLAVEGTYNFRSAGGYAASGRTVREGKLFRSDGLHQLTDAGRAHLAELGIRRVIDLRDRTELEQSPSRLEGLPIESRHNPIFDSGKIPGAADSVTLQAHQGTAQYSGGATGLVACDAIHASMSSTVPWGWWPRHSGGSRSFCWCHRLGFPSVAAIRGTPRPLLRLVQFVTEHRIGTTRDAQFVACSSTAPLIQASALMAPMRLVCRLCRPVQTLHSSLRRVNEGPWQPGNLQRFTSVPRWPGVPVKTQAAPSHSPGRQSAGISRARMFWKAERSTAGSTGSAGAGTGSSLEAVDGPILMRASAYRT